MDEILQCQCGAKVRRPPAGSTLAFRCPRCRTILVPAAANQASSVEESSLDLLAAATAQAPRSPLPLSPLPQPVSYAAPAPSRAVPPPLPASALRPPPVAVDSERASGAAIGAMCPTCQTSIRAGEIVSICPSCRQVHHLECWNEVGGCATYGCDKAPAAPAKTPEAATPLSAWGDTKACPVCGETIKSIAVKCRFCGTDFGTADPLNAGDLHARIERDASSKSMRSSVVALFVCSLIGVLAPLMALIGLIWVLPKRKQLAKIGPVYLILGYSSLGLSLLYSVLMLVFVLTQ